MDSLILLAIIVAAFLIINILSGKIKKLYFRFEDLSAEIQKLRHELEILNKQKPTLEETISQTGIQEEGLIINPEEGQKLSYPPKPVFSETELPKTVSEPAEKVLSTQSQINSEAPLNELIKEREEPVFQEPQPGFIRRFMHQNPDLEKFIGENLINKVGIAILVLGIGYFVKFAIDKDWINEIGRVFIGILTGGLLIGLAHRMRRSFAAFSSVLVGGGLAILYFTIAIAFHEYQLFTQTAAFLLMAVITGFSILLSVSYNRVELAVLALLGGFATPFMVSTGSGNYLVLFSYVLLLNMGMLVLAYLKGWKIINWICYFFTILLFGGWLTTKVLGTVNAPYLGGLLFATLFYVVFFLMNIINNIKERTPFVASEIGILLSNTFLYYSAGMAILFYVESGLYQGIFTVAVAVFNFVFAYVLFRKQQVDRNLVYLLIGLVITFISLAIPVQLEGNYITMFWALEAVLLLWFAQKTGIKLAVISSVIVLLLMLFSLALDWKALYTITAKNHLEIILNKGFITGVIAILSLALTNWLLRKESVPISFNSYIFKPDSYKQIVFAALLMVVYLVLLLELNYQLQAFINNYLNRTIILGGYNLAFIALLNLLNLINNKKTPAIWFTCLAVGGILLYCMHYNLSVYYLLQHHFLLNEKEFIGFPFHYASLFLSLLLLYIIHRSLALNKDYWPRVYKFIWWFIGLIIVYVFSCELLYHVLYFNQPFATNFALNNSIYQNETNTDFYEVQRQTIKVGFPILWGICAFVFMYFGLRKKIKHLRIVALTLFSLTLIKLFVFDIRGISEGGKIAAFICLGILLLVISFMYQNIKKLLLSDERSTGKENVL